MSLEERKKVIRRSIAFLKDVRNEMAQVSWSTPQELWGSTQVVLVSVVLVSLLVGLFDFICALLVNWAIR